MKVHEYQARDILARYAIPLPRGRVATTPAQAREIAQELGGTVVVKAQVLVGGRGKAGGIHLAASPQEAEAAAARILGMDLKGIIVQKVLVTEAADIAQELYLGGIVGRAGRQVVMMASAEGGIDIEEVAARAPEKIFKAAVDPFLGLGDYQARELGFAVGLEPKLVREFVPIARGLYRALVEWDASLAEINPLAVTKGGELKAIDAKIVLDDNAAFRQARFEELRTEEEETAAEREARLARLNFVQLEGSIGCVVNGAGLAMATMDLIKLYGGAPANFLDMGGGARAEQTAAALRIILMDPAVKVVLFNIFGGITRCDEVARGIVAALPTLPRQVPLVVRLVGTNQEQGAEILAQAGISAATDPDEAAKLAIELSRR